VSTHAFPRRQEARLIPQTRSLQLPGERLGVVRLTEVADKYAADMSKAVAIHQARPRSPQP
jgi:hypothetical protein